jgi:hypothetical protein
MHPLAKERCRRRLRPDRCLCSAAITTRDSSASQMGIRERRPRHRRCRSSSQPRENSRVAVRRPELADAGVAVLGHPRDARTGPRCGSLKVLPRAGRHGVTVVIDRVVVAELLLPLLRDQPQGLDVRDRSRLRSARLREM